MTRRRGTLLTLVCFVLATCVQFLLHAHVTDDRHHSAACERAETETLVASAHDTHRTAASSPSVAPAHFHAGDDSPEAPGPKSHESCARCVTPAGDVRVARVAVHEPTLDGVESLENETTSGRAAPRLGYELRGPPAA